MNTQAKKRLDKRAIKREARKGGWHAFFSQIAFDMFGGNLYLRKDGTLVLITMVARKRNSCYLWKDKQYLGRVHSWSRCIWHPEDPRN